MQWVPGILRNPSPPKQHKRLSPLVCTWTSGCVRIVTSGATNGEEKIGSRYACSGLVETSWTAESLHRHDMYLCLDSRINDEPGHNEHAGIFSPSFARDKSHLMWAYCG
jgi:hypothetical protein